MSVPVIRRSESHFPGVHGDTLFRRSWLPGGPERALLVVHGYAEHSGRYEHLGAWFAARGCAVHSYDHRGHGRSSGRRVHVRGFADLLDDLAIALDRVREEHPGLPVFLVGHSMGGLTVAAFARERRPAVAGAVTSGAALALSEQVSRARVRAVHLLSRIAPHLAFRAGIDPEGLSRDPEVVRAYVEDPLVFRKITTSLASELFRAIERTAGGAADVRIPMLMLHGGEDPICPVEGTRRFYDQLTVAGRRLCVYPGLRHEIFNEPEHPRVFQDVLDWLTARKAASDDG